VIGATTVAEALSLVAERVPDVLVSDIGIPQEDGYELMRRVLELPGAAPGIPAIALTAYARAQDRDRALAAGYRRHLAKPIDPARVAQAIAEVLGRA
jgi:CheY-like chemotaxis protein